MSEAGQPRAAGARDAAAWPGAVGRHAADGRARLRWPVAWVVAAAVAVPASLGAFWLARDSGAAVPICGDRPGPHYPACSLPAPWGTGAPPTTSAFTP